MMKLLELSHAWKLAQNFTKMSQLRFLFSGYTRLHSHEDQLADSLLILSSCVELRPTFKALSLQ